MFMLNFMSIWKQNTYRTSRNQNVFFNNYKCPNNMWNVRWIKQKGINLPGDGATVVTTVETDANVLLVKASTSMKRNNENK